MSHGENTELKSAHLMSGRFLSARPSAPPVIKISDQARPIHYISNGSGRDSYICMTDGGLTNPSKPGDPREKFKQTLR
jgi:hypothetical protein